MSITFNIPLPSPSRACWTDPIVAPSLTERCMGSYVTQGPASKGDAGARTEVRYGVGISTVSIDRTRCISGISGISELGATERIGWPCSQSDAQKHRSLDARRKKRKMHVDRVPSPASFPLGCCRHLGPPRIKYRFEPSPFRWWSLSIYSCASFAFPAMSCSS